MLHFIANETWHNGSVDASQSKGQEIQSRVANVTVHIHELSPKNEFAKINSKSLTLIACVSSTLDKTTSSFFSQNQVLLKSIYFCWTVSCVITSCHRSSWAPYYKTIPRPLVVSYLNSLEATNVPVCVHIQTGWPLVKFMS